MSSEMKLLARTEIYCCFNSKEDNFNVNHAPTLTFISLESAKLLNTNRQSMYTLGTHVVVKFGLLVLFYACQFIYVFAELAGAGKHAEAKNVVLDCIDS